MNVVHQVPPTTKGFHFIIRGDEDGFVSVIVRHGSPLLLVEGEVQREGAVTNLLTQPAKATV